MGEEFIEAVRVAEAHIERTQPPRRTHQDALLGQLLERAEGPSWARALRAWWWGAGGLALAATAAALFMFYGPTAPSPTPPAPTIHTAMGLRSTCEMPEQDGRLTMPRGCKYRWLSPDSKMVSLEESVASRRGEDFVLERGAVTFEVDPKRPDPSVVRVYVSGGLIEVLGTKFTIHEDGARGRVVLRRGTIRFTRTGGAPETLSPGDERTWGEVAARTEPEPPAPVREDPASKASAPKKVDRPPKAKPKGRVSASELEMLRELRRLKRYDDALSNLRRLGRRDLDTGTREVLSFERGELLELRGDDACKYWRRHERRFKRGTYRAEVRARLKRCKR